MKIDFGVSLVPHLPGCADPDVCLEARDVLSETATDIAYNMVVYCTECKAARFLGTVEETKP